MINRISQESHTPPLATTSQPLLITVEEAARLLSLGKTTMYDLINNENLPVHRFGKAVRISVTELQTWLDARKAQEEG